MNKIGMFLFASVLLVASGITTAQAETVVCTVIDSLPYTIATQGVYCLTGNLSTGITTGSAITINANNVVLDLNGFKIGGLSAGLGTQAIGISASALNPQNITIKNGTVRGFAYGIDLGSSTGAASGHVIEDIRADQNTRCGIRISAKGATIRNNIVVSTGGTTLWPYTASGISVQGAGAQVLNNTVTDVSGPGIDGSMAAYGIMLFGGYNSVVSGNRVGDIRSPSRPTAGIVLDTGSDILVSDNRIAGAQYGIYFYPGTTGTYMNNLVRSSGTKYTGGDAAGTTNY